MDQEQTSVEWVFGDILSYFASLDFKKNLIIGLSSVGKMYAKCPLIRNLHSCFYGHSISAYFKMNPPSIIQYFQ